MFKALMKLANTACQTLLFVSVSLVKDDNDMAILQQFLFVLSRFINGVIKILARLLIFGMFKALAKLANIACQTLLFVSVSLVKDDNDMAVI